MADSEPSKKKPKLSRATFDKELERLQRELVLLQEYVKAKGLKVVVVFEGRDAAGKGGVIKRITERTSPRSWRIAALATPTERERTQWYFQRYVAHLPAAGEVVLFDRSWYNRAGVERVMGFCTEDEYQEFMRSCPEFERMLVRSGIILIKYWFSVSDAEQERRFRARVSDPMRRWKLSPMDLKSRERWVEYSRAKDDMFAAHRHQAGPLVRRRRQRQAPRPPQLHRPSALDDPLRGRHPPAARAAQAPGRRPLRPAADHRSDLRPRGLLTPPAGIIPPVTGGDLPGESEDLWADSARLHPAGSGPA